MRNLNYHQHTQTHYKPRDWCDCVW